MFECDHNVFVYLNDLILSRLLGQLPDPTDKLLVGCVVSFPRVNHPDAQLHQLQGKRDNSQGNGNKENKLKGNLLCC